MQVRARGLAVSVEARPGLRAAPATLGLANPLLVQAQGKPVRRVHFQVNLLPTYDTPTPQQIQESVSSFLNGTAPIPKYRLSQALRGVHSHARGKRPPIPSLVPVPDSSLSHARSQAPSLPFPLEYPRFRHPYVATGPETLRRYAIRDPQGHLHPSYVIVTQAGSLGQYYDIEGTSWSEPPLLANPITAMFWFYAGLLASMRRMEAEAAAWQPEDDPDTEPDADLHPAYAR